MATGTVKWFNDAKGYGFISPEGGGKGLQGGKASGLRQGRAGRQRRYHHPPPLLDPYRPRNRARPRTRAGPGLLLRAHAPARR